MESPAYEKHPAPKVRQPVVTQKYMQWIWSIATHVEAVSEDCLIWPFVRHDKYARFTYKGRGVNAHRIMCEMAHGPAPFDGAMALHSCGNGHLGCVNPQHLRWGTGKDNRQDARKHGTLIIGEKCHAARLTPDSVLKIRAAIARGDKQKNVARMFGVDPSTIRDIQRGRTWGHVNAN